MTTSIDGFEGDLVEAADPGRLLCEVLVESLPVTGASISVVGEAGQHSIVGATDELAARLEASQYELGVGPHWDALRTARPAFVLDVLAASGGATWASLTAGTARLGAGALFAFPLRLGDATVGVADLYSRSASGPWSDATIERAGDLALRVTAPAVRLATRSANAETSSTGGRAVELRREVHQATGMVMAQLGCDASTALLRLRAHAYATGTPLDALARDVVRGRLDLAEL